MKALLKTVFFFLLLAQTGCVYSDIRLPLDTDVNRTTLGEKVGRSDAHSIMWLVAWGDAGVEAAAQNGGLSQINHLDSETFLVLFGLYSRRTTIAYGN